MIYALNNAVLLDYVDYHLKRKISKATVATYIRHVKVFLSWLCEEYNLQLAVEKMPVPKTPKKNPRIYTNDEITSIFNVIYGDGRWIDVRNCAIVSLMLDSGLRQSEVSFIKSNDVNLNSKIINIFGKGQKERFVPIGNTTSLYMSYYQSICPYSSHEYFFVGKDGAQITSNTIKLFMSKASRKLPFEFSSHKLRHNFGTNFLVDMYEIKGCMDIYALKSLMGHEQIKTTERYLHVANQIIFSRSHTSHVDRISGIAAPVLNQREAYH